MSAAAPAPVKVTAGYAVIPNSLIENQVNLTRAELALALIVLRRGGASDPITVSDRNWESWTGLSARNKEYAISGLKAKGLEVDGRGDQARFRWARSTWEHYVRHAERTKPRTAGRAVQSVAAKAGARVHPSCRDTGCAMLSCTPPAARENSGTGLSLVPATAIAQPVAQVVTAAWAQTLEAVRRFFPLVNVAFLVRLVAMVRALFLDIQDHELAAAVNYAYFQKAGFQKSEGLFLFTVPEAIAALRKLPPKAETPPAQDRYGRAPIVAMIRHVAAALDARRTNHIGARGAPFEQHARALDRLAAKIEGGSDRLEMEALDALEMDLEARQAAITETALDSLPAPAMVKISESVEKQLAPYSRMSADQRANLRRQFTEAETLQALAIPRLGLLYT
jgi:hypothetical protein